MKTDFLICGICATTVLVLSLLKKKEIKAFLEHFNWKEAGKFVQVASTIYKQF